LGCSNPISLGINKKGNLTFQLPSGPKDHDYQIILYVDVFDDSDGVTQYVIPETVVVAPNQDALNQLVESFIAPNNTEFIESFVNSSTIVTISTFMMSLNVMVAEQTLVNSTNGSNSVR